ncbi:hypothetical protein AGR3A_Cc120049 [Agrobacterium tomkonis CFBP 6623]|uniref:Uncharacterized protein n=1 Tax=Agrobacterium tomkonis CFBP 6623 TaxID=1183432 RepID=A0A1S7NMN8_9HYPH|nr:hypothetical protein AGR3A_Cc120049 [Agrobacterium tomkonis CFBP 6623]
MRQYLSRAGKTPAFFPWWELIGDESFRASGSYGGPHAKRELPAPGEKKESAPARVAAGREDWPREREKRPFILRPHEKAAERRCPSPRDLPNRSPKLPDG